MNSSALAAFHEELSLIKRAAEGKKKPKKGITPEQVMGALGGMTGASLLQTGAGALAMPHIQKGFEESGPELQKRFNETAKAMGVKGKVDVAPTGILQEMGGVGPHMGYAKSKDSVGQATPEVARKGLRRFVGGVQGKGEEMMAHELGHAKTDIKLPKKMRGAYRTANMASRNLAMLGSMPAAAIAGGQEEASWTPGLVQAGASAPMMVDEALASGHAARHLVKQHGLGKGLKKALPLLPAYGTYAAVAGAPLAVTAYRKLKAKKKKKGEEAATPPA